jgi:hypothetical protein
MCKPWMPSRKRSRADYENEIDVTLATVYRPDQQTQNEMADLPPRSRAHQLRLMHRLIADRPSSQTAGEPVN